MRYVLEAEAGREPLVTSPTGYQSQCPLMCGEVQN